MKKIATLISFIGNPMSLALFYGASIILLNKDNEQYRALPLLFILFMIVPIGLFIGYQVYIKKNFKDFDVSDQKQRRKLYQFIIVLFSALNVFLIANDYPVRAYFISFVLWIQITLSYFINFKVKVSQHTAFSFLFVFLFLPISKPIALGLFVFSFLNAWSRLALGRHYPREVILGGIMGTVLGVLYVLALTKFLEFSIL